MKILFLILTAALPLWLKADPSEELRQKYAEQMYTAFQLQSIGKSTLAFFTFSDAYQFALKNGEDPSKLAPFETLFIWYRKFGYNCGVSLASSQCTDEYRSPKGYQKKTTYGTNLDPVQEKMTRDFLFGVGQVLSGVFCIVINPPFLGRFGVPLVISGGKYMFDSVSAMIQDSQERQMRLAELETFKKTAEAAAQK